MSRVIIADLQVSQALFNLVNNQICPAVKIDAEKFWQNTSKIFHMFTERNQLLLKKRDALQKQIDQWHNANPHPFSEDEYQKMLTKIGYLHEKSDDFNITTENVDHDLALIAGPQLVVPVNNARYALNAANARWGSLFDALYGSNIIAGTVPKTSGYNKDRGQLVIDYAQKFLDQAIPLQNAKHAEISSYKKVNQQLVITLTNGTTTSLKNTDSFIGYTGEETNPASLLFVHHDLHLEVQLDKNHLVGQQNPAGIKDIILESAITTIQDCEDSVAAVDGEDKTLVYKNWFELMQGTLTVDFDKKGKVHTRTLNKDKEFTDLNNQPQILSGRCTLFVRNVGHRMTTPAILDMAGNELHEGILDAIITVLSSLNDIRGNQSGYRNSKKGSMYIVKPKMHGPEEVSFTNDLFSAIEKMYNLPQNSLKMGLMDEERRTSVNLKECIRIIKDRIVFINTGFLDRTGDEIHTSMKAGAFELKGNLKKATWLSAYEDQNINIGLQCGFHKRAQIGKGMWAMPDDMAGMMDEKIAHPKSGANTAWVPSPTAATLHAIHYHQINVFEQQKVIAKRPHRPLKEMLSIALSNSVLTKEEIKNELENNCQSLLGYVVRWVDQGVGCSKVSDINHIALMEDRATLRISSQHIANWLYHGVIDKQMVEKSLEKMASIVDQQNENDRSYQTMAPSFDGIAYQTARQLIFNGIEEPNGYTEPTLHAQRFAKKNS